MRPSFPISRYPLTLCPLSKFPTRSMYTQERFLVKLSCQIDEVLIDLVLKSGDIQPLLQTELLVF